MTTINDEFDLYRLMQETTTATPTSAPTTEDELASPSDSEKIRDTLIIYGSIFVVLWLFFCLVRRRHPKTFQVRWVNPKYRCALAEEQYGLFSWMYKLILVNEDDLMEQCGLDALCFLRIIQFGTKVALMGVVNSVWLMPIYATAPASDETAYIDDGVTKLSASNIPPSNARSIATVVASYIVFGFTIKLLFAEFEWFTAKRHLFLSKTWARNYTIYLAHIPFELRSNAALYNYFADCYGHDAVLEAHIAMDLANLEAKVAAREALVWKLEHAINVQDVKGKTPTHSSSFVGGSQVNSIQAYSEELRQMNQDIRQDVIRIHATQDVDLLRKQQGTLEDKSSDEEEGLSEVSPKLENESMISSIADESAFANMHKKPKPQDHRQEEEEEEETPPSSKNSSWHNNVVTQSLGKGASAAMSLLKSEDGSVRESGFISFRNLVTTQAAKQMVHSHKPYVMLASEAPAPKEIMWGSVGKNHKQIQTGRLVALGLTVALCLFWTIPVSFVASLASVDVLAQRFDWLADALEKNPWLEQLLAQLAPLLIVGLNLILPYILMGISLLELPISSSLLETSTFVKLATFMIIQTFFVSAISGGIFEALSDIAANPSEFIDLLATSLPAQAMYFVQILLVGTFLGMPIECLNVGRVLVAKIRSWFGPGLTEKERNTPWMGLITLVEPWEFMYSFILGKMVLYFMVTFVYATLTPLTNYFLVLCYIIMDIGWRHQLIYIYPPIKDSGGRLWTGFVGIVIGMMLIAQIVLLGWFGIKKAPVSAGLMVPLLVATIWFAWYINQRHFVATKNLPTGECIDTDYKNMPLDYASFLEGEYLQPALKAEEMEPENGQLIFFEDAESSDVDEEEHLIDVDYATDE